MKNKKGSVIPSAPSAKTPTISKLEDKSRNGGPDKIQKQIKVLIIDDFPQISRAVLRNLKRVGVKQEDVVLAKDGKEGLDRIATEEFDLIITDNQMPNMSGEVMVLRLSDEGKTEIVDKIVLQTGEPFSIMQETKTTLSGRVLDKNGAGEQLTEIAKLLMDGGTIKGWVPKEPKTE